MTPYGKEGPPLNYQEKMELLRFGKWKAREEIEALKNAITPEGLSKPEVLSKALSKYFQARFTVDGSRADLKIIVPEFPLGRENELKVPMKRRLRSGEATDTDSAVLFLPEELTGEEGLVRAGKMYPWLEGDPEKMAGEEGHGMHTLLPNTPVTNTHETHGYIRVEASPISPNRMTTEGELREFAEKNGLQMQREIVNILFSLMIYDLYGKFIDQYERGGKNNNFSRLGGSQINGAAIITCWNSDGHLTADRAEPEISQYNWGGRFEQAIKT